jgi:HPt (histidine-containing phosphotransfer) domain-containing protein
MTKTSAVDAILKQLTGEFLESCGDSLCIVDDAITRLMDAGDWDEDFPEILRRVHSIKGGGGTFGFSAITMIAHALEDYIETAGKVGTDHLPAIQAYADAIRDIADSGENPSDSGTTEILRALPHSGTVTVNAIATEQTLRVIGFLLILPKGLQRRIIAAELASCGFRVSLAENAVQAIEIALANPPHIIAASMINEDMSGIELAHVFKAMGATREARFMLMTSSEETDPEALGLPADARVARKGDKFPMDMTNHLIEWGVFGKIKA